MTEKDNIKKCNIHGDARDDNFLINKEEIYLIDWEYGGYGDAISSTDYYMLSGKKKITASVTDPENYSEEYINRDTVAVMSSPHAFKYGYIDDLYKEAVRTGIIDNIEPHTTTLMYAMGKKIFFSYGSQNNIKITRKEDLDLFEGYVLMKQRRLNEAKK